MTTKIIDPVVTFSRQDDSLTVHITIDEDAICDLLDAEEALTQIRDGSENSFHAKAMQPLYAFFGSIHRARVSAARLRRADERLGDEGLGERKPASGQPSGPCVALTSRRTA